MPFTFAHPLFAAPIKLIKPKYVSLTGIILGSMSPDFEYFILLEPYQSIGHTIKGLLYAMPLCIFLAYLFHTIIKEPLSRNLTSLFDMDRRSHGMVQAWKLNSVRSWLVFVISVVIGFYSHILVDSFTHRSGFFVVRFTFLQLDIMGLPLYKLLQYSLSLLGLMIQAAILIYMLRKVPMNINYVKVTLKVKGMYWLITILIAVLTVMIKLTFTSSANYLGIVIVSPITGLFIGIVISSLIFRSKGGKHSI